MRSESRYAFFDMDHTLTSADTGLLFLRWWALRHPVSFWRLAGAPLVIAGWKLGLLPLRRVKEFCFSMLRGRRVDEVDRAAREFAGLYFPRLCKIPALELLRDLAGTHTLVLASASPEFYVRYFAERFGFEHFVATRYEIRDGRYTGRMDGDDCRDGEKVRRIAAIVPLGGYDRDESVAFSDNVVADGPLLDLAGQQFRVHPKKWQFVPFSGIRPRQDRRSLDFD